MDVDDLSLPSSQDDEGHYDGRRRLPLGTLSLPEDDNLVSVSDIIMTMKERVGHYHFLDLQHAGLGDTRMEKVLEQLRKMYNNTLHGSDEAATNLGQPDCYAASIDWLNILAPRTQLSKTHPWPSFSGVRFLDLSNNGLTSDCLPAISKLLAGNVTLSRLDLKSNDIDGENGTLSDLAKAVGKSGLKDLSLSSNPISLQSLAAFFDAVPATGTELECLELSGLISLGDDETSDEQNVFIAQSIADFLTDPQRCRCLLELQLNGNVFNERSVRLISSAVIRDGDGDATNGHYGISGNVAALRDDPLFRTILESTRRRPNFHLRTLGLAGNIEGGWLPAQTAKDSARIDAIRRRYAPLPLANVEAIVSFFHHRACKRRLHGKERDNDEIPAEMQRHMTSIGVTLDDWEIDFQDALVFGLGLTHINRNELTWACLSRNRAAAIKCRKAALTVLASARTLGCKASVRSSEKGTAVSESEKHAEGFSRFFDLPPELRLHVLRQLDEDGCLSASQFSHVISFACEPSTIGYGGRGYDWTLVTDSECPIARKNGANASATLPAQRWSWAECFTLRATPRDWEAAQLDGANLVGDKSSYRGSAMLAFFGSTLTHRSELP
ncbi:hypothetical protein PHSY_004894 [Pseudozyma hubeiensis SY62]|uniref:Uncharacterized protein n=1 Tax=Pseudozyma hubeiensis (strain SY62) TaxID=1305764 RepID=R9P7J9_PSEHS|nr:hypothetical protein PHSY_004894 [Pseudozyma hubeiensis SY62]GAC97309.1 hypothetical protein PHSY_004894 [Pseudozyma hubeiensis SY62]